MRFFRSLGIHGEIRTHTGSPRTQEVNQELRSRLFAALAVSALGVAPALGQAGNLLSFATITARPGEQRVISLNGVFSTPMSGMVVTVLFDPSVIQIQSVTLPPATQAFTVRSTVTGGRLTLAMAGANGITMLSADAVVRISVRVIGAPGSVSVLDIASAVVNEGAVTATITDGSLRVVREASISGFVLYHANLEPVANAILTATGTATVRDTTDNSGAYALGPTEVGDYAVTVTRQGAAAPAVDALDAAEILRSLIGAIVLSPGQSVVADVSANGVVGTTDAVLILRLLVGLEQTFPAGPFWQFRPSALQFRPLIQDEFRSLTAYLMGDVDGSWPSGSASTKPLALATPRLHLDALPVRSARRGAVVLSGEALEDVRGGVVELRYDRRMLKSTGVRGVGQSLLVAANAQTPGVVRVAFAGAEGLSGTADLLRFDFAETGPAGASTRIRIRAARLNRQDLPAASLETEDYALDRQVADVNLDGNVDLTDFYLLVDNMGRPDPRFDLDESGQVDLGDLFVMLDRLGPAARARAARVASALGAASPPALEQNAPNPFNTGTTISYSLAADGPVQLDIYDAVGQRVRRLVDAWRPAGAHQASWDGRNDDGQPVASGAYVYQLRAGAQVMERKLTLLR